MSEVETQPEPTSENSQENPAWVLKTAGNPPERAIISRGYEVPLSVRNLVREG